MTYFHGEACADVMLGDCVESMRKLPDRCVNMCVTSPPYFGLRDYGHAGQIGLEQTPDEYVAKLVEVFREVRRVLRDDGTLWLNLGDSYARNASKGGSGPGGKNIAYSDTYGAAQSARVGSSDGKVGRGARTGTRAASDGLKEKDLIGIPWMVAFALRADGWYLRQEIIWHKPNPMPESVTDRCTKAHEQLFLLSKYASYYCDMDAIKEPAKYSGLTGQDASGFKNAANFNGKHAASTGVRGEKRSARDSFKRNDSNRAAPIVGQNAGTHRPDRAESSHDVAMRNRRSVWTIATRPYKGAHFATFPPDLVEPCVIAGAPVGGVVLDPFGGSGTTAGVALRNGRNAILCELNPEYAALVEARIGSLCN